MKTICVVAAVICENGSIFATQRGYGDFKGGWEFPGGKIEPGETPQAALIREIREELDTEISVGDLIDTVEYDYPNFHLSMDCFWCSIVSGDLVLKEHEAAKWLDKDSLFSVEWLPADVSLIGKIKNCLSETRFDLQYCYQKALEKIKEKYPNAGEDCFAGDYAVAYWNDKDAYVNRKGAWEYPGSWYPGLIAYTDDKMIEFLVKTGVDNLAKNLS